MCVSGCEQLYDYGQKAGFNNADNLLTSAAAGACGECHLGENVCENAALFLALQHHCTAGVRLCVCAYSILVCTASLTCVHVFVATRMRYLDSDPRRLFGYQCHFRGAAFRLRALLSNTVSSSSFEEYYPAPTFHLQPSTFHLFLCFYWTSSSKWQE